MSYGIDYADLFLRSADYIDRILKGASPRDLPVQQPTKFELVINLKTAKARDITLSTTARDRGRSDRVRSCPCTSNRPARPGDEAFGCCVADAYAPLRN